MEIVEIENLDAVNLIENLTAEVERLRSENEDLRSQLHFMSQSYNQLVDKLEKAAEVLGDHNSEEVAVEETK